MGQGSDSVPDFDDYDEYDSDISNGYSMWTQKSGGSIAVEKMANSHISNTIRLCKQLKKCATFSCEEEKWQDWIDVFTQELADRAKKGIVIYNATATRSKTGKRKNGKPKSKAAKNFKNTTFTSSTQQMKCHCGSLYTARVADLKRGWALSCSKRCAAIKRDYGRPDATPV